MSMPLIRTWAHLAVDGAVVETEVVLQFELIALLGDFTAEIQVDGHSKRFLLELKTGLAELKRIATSTTAPEGAAATVRK